MTSTPTLSFSGLITNALMNNSGDPSVWNYSIDISTLTVPSNGDYFITVGGSDIAGNIYTNASGAQDGNETAVCNLASIALPAFIETNEHGSLFYNYDKLHEVYICKLHVHISYEIKDSNCSRHSQKEGGQQEAKDRLVCCPYEGEGKDRLHNQLILHQMADRIFLPLKFFHSPKRRYL